MRRNKDIMKKKMVSIGCLFIVALLCIIGCGKQTITDETESRETEQQEESKMSEGVKMTREYAIEKGIVTEEELSGVDFEAMVEKYGFFEGLEEQMNLREGILNMRTDFPLDGFAFDYQYLADNEKSNEKITNEDFSNLKIIAWQYNSGTYHATLLFDFAEKTAYFGECVDLLQRAAEPTEEMDLTDEQIESIKSVFQENHVEKWKEEYYQLFDTGNCDGYWWALYYELEDGRIYKHSGDYTPNNYDSVTDALKAYFGDIPY